MLTVLSVAFPMAPVGPDAVGGAEQVLTMLDAALVEQGHRSIVIACEGSSTRGTLLATAPPDGPLSAPDTWARTHERHRAAIREALDRWPVNLVHMHGVDFHRYLPEADVPVLATLHLPTSWYPTEALAPSRPRTYLNCVSSSQRSACPPNLAPPMVIPNGVPVPRFEARVRRREFCAALGRICPEKGYHLALDAAEQADIALLLAGYVYPHEAHQQYWRAEIAPRLDRRRRFIGPLGFRGKRRLLSAARCLLAPSLAPETSSLVAMESLACGTPVVAFPSGALAEIVEHGHTGFLVHDAHEMADAIGATGELDPNACRSAARERFSSEVCVRAYLSLYERLASSPTVARPDIPATAPHIHRTATTRASTHG
jgi:glycosyltransferase involved in cell wall biosynthesis